MDHFATSLPDALLHKLQAISTRLQAHLLPIPTNFSPHKTVTILPLLTCCFGAGGLKGNTYKLYTPSVWDWEAGLRRIWRLAFCLSGVSHDHATWETVLSLRRAREVTAGTTNSFCVLDGKELKIFLLTELSGSWRLMDFDSLLCQTGSGQTIPSLHMLTLINGLLPSMSGMVLCFRQNKNSTRVI